jgi:predicted DNA-binding transcriptional regulator AlpA
MYLCFIEIEHEEKIMDTREISVYVYPDGRLDTKNAALYMGFKEKTLAMMRSDGKGPKFIKLGRIFYFKSDIDAWINERARCISTSQSRFSQQLSAVK